MKVSNRIIISIALLLIISNTGLAEDIMNKTMSLPEGGASPKADLSQIEWLAGYWQGEGLGGVIEENWSPPLGNSMTGTFKLITEGQDAFYEFFIVTEEAQSLILKLKHFNPDMSGWEEKDKFVTFRLVKIDGNTAYFDGLTYNLQDVDTLQIFLRMKHGDKTEEMELLLNRISK
ncbi:MAG: DUF6265 family protein [Candidatus Zixiibacteriota bacterium]